MVVVRVVICDTTRNSHDIDGFMFYLNEFGSFSC